MEAASADNHEDAEAIRRALHGDEDAWRALVEKYRHHVYRLAYRVTFNEEDALDAMQETFLKVANSLSKFNRRDRFVAWVTTIALREATNICRKRSRTPQPMAEEILNAKLDVVSKKSDAAAPWEHLEQTRQLLRVQAAMEELSPQQRAIILLGINNDMSPAEVAREMQLPANQVRSQWSRAVAKLQNLVSNDTAISTRTSEQGAIDEQ